MKKQTAVEYLVDQLLPKALTAEQYYHIEKAKAMEKEQIQDAWVNSLTKGDFNSSEEYYQKTYAK